MTSIAQQIRDGIASLAKTEVQVDEWSCTICLLELTGTLADTWEQHHRAWVGRLNKPTSKVDVAGRAVLVGLSIIDEHQKRPFADKAGFATLSEASGTVIDDLFTECCKLNKFGGWEREDGDGGGEEDDVKKPEDDQESDSGES